MVDRGSTSTISPVNTRKISKVMSEWKDGKLKSSSGKPVSNRKQAITIALSEARRSYEEDQEMKYLPIKKAVERFIEMVGEDDFNDLDPEDMIKIPCVILFTTGKYPQGDVNKEDLKLKEDSARLLGNKRPAILKITHDSKDKHSKLQKNYPYAVGEIDPESIKAIGEILGGDVEMFKWVADDIYKGYIRSSSAEIKEDLETQDGKVLPKVFDALSLLGSVRESQWEKINSYESIEDGNIKIYKYEEMIMEDEKKPEKTMYEEISGMYSEMKAFQGEMSNIREEMKSYSETMKNYMEMMKPKENEEEEKEGSDASGGMYSEIEMKLVKLQQEKEDAVRKYSEFENKTFIENMVTTGKLLPVLQEDSLQILNNLPAEKTISYSENGQDVEISLKDKFKNFLTNMGKLNLYEEVAPAGREEAQGSKNEDEIEVTEADRKEYPNYSDEEIKKHKKIVAYAEKNQLSYAEAFNVIFG
jgi:hypothetical protein